MSDTCSAVPADLKAYAAAGLHMDCLLRAQAGRLQDAIDRLRASHPDSSVLGRVLPVGSNLTHYATRNSSTDVWVGDVGEAFQHANGNANPHQVQTASSRTINATLKLEEPHGPPGAEVLARLDPKARGSIFTNWHSAADWLRQNKGWLAMHWAFFAMGGDLPLILSPLTGFRITFAGGWAELHGPRVGYQASLLKRYMQSANLDRWSMLKGKPEIAKFYRPVTAIPGA